MTFHNLQTMRPSYDQPAEGLEHKGVPVIVNGSVCNKCGRVKLRSGLLCSCFGCEPNKCDCATADVAGRGRLRR